MQSLTRAQQRQVMSMRNPPDCPPPYRLQEAAIGAPSIDYSKYHPHFLSLPFEIRERTYEFMLESSWDERSGLWSDKPCSMYDRVELTCRQMYHEIQNNLLRFKVTSNRLQKFCDLPQSNRVLRNARSLTIELRFNTDIKLYRELASALECLQLSLQELRLFFIGEDKYGKEVKVHGCALNNDRVTTSGKHHQEHHREDKLLANGQYSDRQLQLLRSLTVLRNLRSLVVSNANTICFQSMFLMNKPLLKSLCVETDPRTSLHAFLDYKRSSPELKSLLVEVKKDFPPVEVLQIGANTTLLSIQIVNKLMRTLEHLTWTTPNPSLQSGFPCDWYRQSAILLREIRFSGHNLKTLRLCIDNRLHEESYDISEFIGSMRSHLSWTRLKNLEIHICNGSPWFAQEFIESLPDTLERLYITDRTIGVQELVRLIEDRYITTNRDEPCSHTPHEAWRASTEFPSEQQSFYTNPPRTSNSDVIDWSQKDATYDTAVIVTVNSFNLVNYSSKSATENDKRKSLQTLCIPREVGISSDEDEGFITYAELDPTGNFTPQFGTGHLGFVTYEYSNDSSIIDVLRLNGRLLERERNRHMMITTRDLSQHYAIAYVPGMGSMPTTSTTEPPSERPETATYSKHMTVHLRIYSEDETRRSQEEIEENHSDLVACGLIEEALPQDRYFGDEDIAEAIFAHENVARITDMKLRTLPVDVAVESSNKCTWMAPEYDVPAVGRYPTPIMPRQDGDEDTASTIVPRLGVYGQPQMI